jgi:hypothetical protein
LTTPSGIVLIEVKRKLDERTRRFALEELWRNFRDDDRVAFVLLIDKQEVQVYRRLHPDAEPVAEFATAPILRAYDPDFETEIIYEDYLESLVRRWLNDFSFAKRGGAEPPGSGQLPDDVRAVLAA